MSKKMSSSECENLNFLFREYGIIEILKYLYFFCQSENADYWKMVKDTIDETLWDEDPIKEYYMHQIKGCEVEQ